MNYSYFKTEECNFICYFYLGMIMNSNRNYLLISYLELLKYCIVFNIVLLYIFTCKFSLQPVLHNWYNKGCDMCYPVCEMMNIKEHLLLIRMSTPCGATGFLSRYLSSPYHMSDAI